MKLFKKANFDPMYRTYKTIVWQIKLAKMLKKIHKEILKLEDIKKWLNFKTYTITPIGVIHEEKVVRLDITITEDAISINGETDAGTYLHDCINGDLKEAQEVSAKMVEKYKQDLIATKESYLEELKLIDSTLSNYKEQVAKENAKLTKKKSKPKAKKKK